MFRVNTSAHKLPPLSQLGPFIALAVACVVFGLTTDNFLTGANFALILQQVMVVGVIAIGQTLIILTAGIDLSCGMLMALGSIVMTKFATELGLPTPLAILAGGAAAAVDEMGLLMWAMTDRDAAALAAAGPQDTSVARYGWGVVF